MKQFTNPYAQCVTNGDASRLNCDIKTEVYKYIQSCRLTRGTMQTTVNILIEKLYVELKRRKIKHHTQSVEFEQFLVECELTLPLGITIGGVVREEDVGHDGGGVKELHSTPTREHTEHGVVENPRKRGSKR